MKEGKHILHKLLYLGPFFCSSQIRDCRQCNYPGPCISDTPLSVNKEKKRGDSPLLVAIYYVTSCYRISPPACILIKSPAIFFFKGDNKFRCTNLIFFFLRSVNAIVRYSYSENINISSKHTKTVFLTKHTGYFIEPERNNVG